MVADLGLPQVPKLPGRQFIQGLLAFTQAQPRHEPVLLHLQQGILIRSSSIYFFNIGFSIHFTSLTFDKWTGLNG